MKKPLVCIYSEGTELKVSVFSREKEIISIHKNFVIEKNGSGTVDPTEQLGDFTDDILEDSEISFDVLDNSDEPGQDKPNNANEISELASNLAEYDLSKAQFIPIITDPDVNFHIYEGALEKDKKKTLDKIIDEIQSSKGLLLVKDQMDFISLDEKTHLCVFTESNIASANLINTVANYNGKRYYKISSIKNAETALANFVSRTTKFFPEDYSLIIYIGREFSKLIFLEGQNLKHIGATLDIGTQNLHTYDVYFSKILLEMENGGIPRLDNVVICGDDKTENLVLSFYGTFPEANVSELKFDMFNIKNIEEENQKDISSYSVPIAAAYEYYAEIDKELVGINILPRYILENQKFLQFGWHSFAMLPILFGVTFYLTFAVLSNYQEMNELDGKIKNLEFLALQNQNLLDQMDPLSKRISNFDNTQAILDSAMSGTEIWGHSLDKISNFMERRRNFWIAHLEGKNNSGVTIRGYSLSRNVLTEFSEFNNSSILQNVLYEPLREKNAFAYIMNFKIEKDKN
jgi:hypothetical protein